MWKRENRMQNCMVSMTLDLKEHTRTDCDCFPKTLSDNSSPTQPVSFLSETRPH